PRHRRLAPRIWCGHSMVDSHRRSRFGLLKRPGSAGSVHRRLRSGSDVAEPFGDDRDTDRVSACPGVRRAVPARVARTGVGRRRGGAGWALASLGRPSVLPGTLLSIATAAIARPGSPRARLVRAGLMGCSVLTVLSPWMIRNLIQLGEPIWTTTHGGYTLALA